MCFPFCFTVHGSEFTVQSSRFRVHGSRFRVFSTLEPLNFEPLFSYSHHLFHFSQVKPFFHCQIVRPEGISGQFQPAEAKEFVGVRVKILRLFFRAVFARPFQMLLVVDFRRALCPILGRTQSPPKGLKIFVYSFGSRSSPASSSSSSASSGSGVCTETSNTRIARSCITSDAYFSTCSFQSET